MFINKQSYYTNHRSSFFSFSIFCICIIKYFFNLLP